MKRKNPKKHVHGYHTQHGKLVWYYRLPGSPKIRLEIDEGVLPWSPSFMAALETAKTKAEGKPPELGAARTIPGTVNAAIISYYGSSTFKALAGSSQKMRRAILERFRQDHGDKRIALLRRQHVQVILDKKSAAAARNWKKTLRKFFDHCLASDLIAVDPLAGVQLGKMKTKGHHPWEASECAQYEARHPIGTRARLAYELLLQAGQSRCDVVRMGRQHIRDGILSMPRQKTDFPFNVTITPRLQEAIDALPESNMTFLVTTLGKPFTAAGFGNWFRDRCREAELPARCTSHGLRKAAATYLAELGATDHQLMAWFGWSSISMAQIYTRAANRKRMAQKAAKLISGTGIGSPSDPGEPKTEKNSLIVRGGK